MHTCSSRSSHSQHVKHNETSVNTYTGPGMMLLRKATAGSMHGTNFKLAVGRRFSKRTIDSDKLLSRFVGIARSQFHTIVADNFKTQVTFGNFDECHACIHIDKLEPCVATIAFLHFNTGTRSARRTAFHAIFLFASTFLPLVALLPVHFQSKRIFRGTNESARKQIVGINTIVCVVIVGYTSSASRHPIS